MSENAIYILLGLGLFALSIGTAFCMPLAELSPADRTKILKELRNGLRTKFKQKFWTWNTKKEK